MIKPLTAVRYKKTYTLGQKPKWLFGLVVSCTPITFNKRYFVLCHIWNPDTNTVVERFENDVRLFRERYKK